jgi:hypothetical protein
VRNLLSFSSFPIETRLRVVWHRCNLSPEKEGTFLNP